ncbi:MAG TPA: ATP synthase F1 subunit delta [Gemmatimonadales bacterium]|nr:ATP synthase F1 subunit delta [Gemmatimonadales bacterium]
MSRELVARNYAEALYELGERTGGTVAYAGWLGAVAGAVAASPRAQAVLMSPRVTKAAKARLLTASLRDAPEEFARFTAAVVKRGRQGLLGLIADAYQARVDEKLGRVRAHVVLAREADEKTRTQVTAALAQALGKEVISTFSADPGVIGGAVVRVGGRVYDGSLRRRLAALRRQLLAR